MSAMPTTLLPDASAADSNVPPPLMPFCFTAIEFENLVAMRTEAALIMGCGVAHYTRKQCTIHGSHGTLPAETYDDQCMLWYITKGTGDTRGNSSKMALVAIFHSCVHRDNGAKDVCAKMAVTLWHRLAHRFPARKSRPLNKN